MLNDSELETENTQVKFSPKLALWYQAAYAEIGSAITDIDKSYAIFPQRWYKTIETFDHEKIYDFCFIGAYKINEETRARREWIIDFVEKNFTDNSYLQFTDKMTKTNYRKLGDFDFTLEKTGFVPREVPVTERNFFDENYYKAMCKSKYTLCPGGDGNWSMRFYEALMCRSIPILFDHNAYRTKEEKKLPYNYYVLRDSFKFSELLVERNYAIFLRYHTLGQMEGFMKSSNL